MRHGLPATTAMAGALLLGQAASAQGIALFGDARLGLGYNIDNDGGIVSEFNDAGEVQTPDELRAVSRVRFGVNMTGVTDSGIAFGAAIRADNAVGGEGGEDDDGQTEGDVFVSGAFGTLTYGDTNGADEQWVGDVPGDFSLTGLGELDETRFVSNGGSFGADDGVDFAANPVARPTVRYDFDYRGFGLSLSTNRDLTDVGVGAGYAADFAGGSWTVGAGYYKFDSFFEVGNPQFSIDDNGDVVEVIAESLVPKGDQWSVGLKAEYGGLSAGATYASLSSDTSGSASYEADSLLLGAAYTFDAWSVGVNYGKIVGASGQLDDIDGEDSYELSGQYDLGGGASLNGGIRRTYNLVNEDGSEADAAWIGDFGITMSF